MSAYSALQDLWQIDTEKVVAFLLVQSGKVISAGEKPINLWGTELDESYDWAVYIGHINEFGKREVVAPVALVEGLEPGAATCRISSPADGYSRLIGAVNPILPIVKLRLNALHKSNLFTDLCNLPQTLRITRDSK